MTRHDQRVRMGVAIATTLGLLSACGSTRPLGGSGDPEPLDRLSDDATAVDCDLAVRCHVFSEPALCPFYFQFGGAGFNSLGATVAAAKAGKVRYDAGAARACLDAIAATACSAFGSSSPPAPSSCQAVFTGTLADGSRCITDDECRPGSFCAAPLGAAPCDGTCARGGTMCNDDTHCTNGQICDGSLPTATSSGTCVAPTPAGALNQPCGSRNACQPGLSCGSGTAGNVCLAAGQAGQPCATVMGFFGGCAEGLICVFSDDGTSTSCMAPVAKGGSCQARGQCGGLVSTLTCDDTTHLCVDLPSSGPCVDPTLACNPLSSFCDVSGGTPTCTPYRAIGATCNLGGNDCGVPAEATCVSMNPTTGTGTCAAPVTVESCTP